LDDVQVALCEAHLDTWPPLTICQRGEHYHVIINTAFDAPVTRLGAQLLAQEHVHRHLADHVPVATDPIAITDAFCYPIVPNSTTHLNEMGTEISTASAVQIVRELARKYRVNPPGDSWALVYPPEMANMTDRYPDLKEVLVVNHDVGIAGNRCMVSPAAVKDLGLVYANGYWISEAAWAPLRKWISPYVFYVDKVDL
jgi:hypothetical protein